MDKKQPKCQFSKTHIAEARRQARRHDRKYAMAIIKWDGERTYVPGDTKSELIRFARSPLKAGDYVCVKIVEAKARREGK